jgi:pimeloyl-ACP methyl ester carboxylesterase
MQDRPVTMIAAARRSGRPCAALCANLVLAASSVLVLAPAAGAATAGWKRIEVPATGTYALRYLPPALAVPNTPPVPAVVFLHGSGSSPELWQARLQGLADGLGFVAVLPAAVSPIGFGPGDDAATVSAVLAAVAAEIPLAGDRLAIAGHSSGGAFAAVLALAGRDERFAGVFALGIPYRSVLELGEPAYAPPVRLYYGGDDPNLTGGHLDAWVVQLDRLGVPHEVAVAPGFGHNSWPDGTLETGFAFLLAQRYRTAAGCTPSPTRLCLGDGRYAVEASWTTPAGGAGTARVAAARSGDSGLFWFFRPDNWELQVKVLDGCALTGHWWVFAAATTDVEYSLTVTDLTAPDHPAVYHHAGGEAAPAITDTLALDTCP